MQISKKTLNFISWNDQRPIQESRNYIYKVNMHEMQHFYYS